MDKRNLSFLFFAVLLVLLVGCRSEQTRSAANFASFELTSTAFEPDGEIPSRYSCDGDDISPPLAWRGYPEGTQSFALVLDDPDAESVAGFIWDHWILYDLPADTNALPENIPPVEELSSGARHGQNSWKRLGYGGPCPPRGTHRYHFKLYALDTSVLLEAGATKEELLVAMEDHILALGQLMGSYTR